MHYQRNYTKGATYFFTVVTFRRYPILTQPQSIKNLRQAIKSEMQRRPFQIDAIIILPDHIHTIWTLPPEESDYSTRWKNIKSTFTKTYPTKDHIKPLGSRKQKKEQVIWQRRFWEHRIRNEQDFENHINYIHYNPVKHSIVQNPTDWPYSSIHAYIKKGTLSPDWGTQSMNIDLNIGNE